MKKDNKYEKMYDILLDYEKMIHERNQRRIRIGLKCIWIIPLIFLCLLFWTNSSKIIFLILWIVSLFAIAMYLITVEYMDYRLQEKLHELDEDAQISSLMTGDINNNVENVIKAAISRLDMTLNSQEELRIAEANNTIDATDIINEEKSKTDLIEDKPIEKIEEKTSTANEKKVEPKDTKLKLKEDELEPETEIANQIQSEEKPGKEETEHEEHI